MNLRYSREVMEQVPKDPYLSPFCKKCRGNIYRRKGDICYSCYEGHCAFRDSVLFRQLITPGQCCLCSKQVPVHYKETDVGAVCPICFERHESIFKWKYDEKRKVDRHPQPKQNDNIQAHRCTKCKSYFEDLSIPNITLCQKCFTKKYENASAEKGGEDNEPPILEKMEKKKSPSKRAPRKKIAEVKKDTPYPRPSSKIIAQLNKKAAVVSPALNRVPITDMAPAMAPTQASLPNNPYATHNYQPAIPDNSFDWYSQPPPPYQQQQMAQPVPILPTTSEAPMPVPNQFYPEQPYQNDTYQNVYNGYNGYNGYNEYNGGYNQFEENQQEYPQYPQVHPSWNQEYPQDPNYGNYDHNFQ